MIDTHISPIEFVARFTAAELDTIYASPEAKWAFERLTARDRINLRGDDEHHDFMTIACFAFPSDAERVRLHQILQLKAV